MTTTSLSLRSSDYVLSAVRAHSEFVLKKLQIIVSNVPVISDLVSGRQLKRWTGKLARGWWDFRTWTRSSGTVESICSFMFELCGTRYSIEPNTRCSNSISLIHVLRLWKKKVRGQFFTQQESACLTSANSEQLQTLQWNRYMRLEPTNIS